MTYRYVSVTGVEQSTLISKPLDTTLFHVPQTVYESTEILTPAVGKAVVNPTWKLFKPFTTAVQTKVSSNASNNILIEDFLL